MMMMMIWWQNTDLPTTYTLNLTQGSLTLGLEEAEKRITI